MKLVIVESPAKCNTIQRYLGQDYLVKASLGHVRDLSTSGKGGLGVNIENGFTPSYKICSDKKNVVKELQTLSKQADEVILATDPDREGEAIAWHLAQVLNLNVDKNKRLEFHEITRASITEAMTKPRTIDLDLVASQETRRIVDRIIGFKLSSLLNKKIHSRSAGRVQSATLKLIYEHDKEIKNFVSEEYWNILVSIICFGKDFNITYCGVNGEKKDIKDGKSAEDIIKLIPNELKVKSLQKSIKTTESHTPFTTSTLQQEAFAKLRFKTKKTQFVAQSLYEGIDVAGEHMGLITYMRTDSSRLSPTYVKRATDYILEAYGKEYLEGEKHIKANFLSQDAHEAIRPTSNHRTPESVRQFLTSDQYNLYKLIYCRTLASLMKPKKEEVLDIVLEGNGVEFKFQLSRILFKGFEILYKEGNSKDYYGDFPNINIGDSFIVSSKKCEQKFTEPPAHYSEAKIVKIMEEVGIGRPSTYASTIELLRKRKYVDDDKGILKMTDQGMKTVEFLEKFFPDVINSKYTADMEKKLDSIQEGNESRNTMLYDFYGPFQNDVNSARDNIFVKPNLTGENCPKCGHPLKYIDGKNGRFIGCSNFPTCNYIKKEEKEAPVLEYIGRNCPKCGKPLVKRIKNGKDFIACSGFPTCKYTEKIAVPTPANDGDQNIRICPKCGGTLVKKKGKYGYFYGCSNYPSCNYMEKLKKKKQ